MSETIKVYSRIRPPRQHGHSTASRVQLDQPTPVDHQPQLHFNIPKDISAGWINNQRERFDFKFEQVFDENSKQEEVFDVVAKDVALSVLEGYNGTVFAYGQTGSGKTFTITGGAERYADRGLIPRSIQFLFREMAKRTDFKFEVHISYLEIYNEVGYDLLSNDRDATKLEDLPKVSLLEDGSDMIHLRNLSYVPVLTEEEALNLLFVGDTNKMIAETPSNPASSRSHCLFIISITSRKEAGDVIRKAKFHLVDLAGYHLKLLSERVSKTKIDGTLLKEAKYINLSLHYLEHVIIALHEKATRGRTHVPYRNSMMTSILRDSLGGNCKTKMIATIAIDDELMDESISTCRFSQRVALIENTALLNEELDPQLVIARLKREIIQLRAELAIARGDSEQNLDEPLPDYEIARCRQAVEDYLQDSSQDAKLIYSDFRKIHCSFQLLKELVNIARNNPLPASVTKQDNSVSSDVVLKLRNQVAQRDNEINILIPMINTLKKKLAKYEPLDKESEKSHMNSIESHFTKASSLPSMLSEKMTPIAEKKILSEGNISSIAPEASKNIPFSILGQKESEIQLSESVSTFENLKDSILDLDPKEKRKAFEEFKKHYEPYEKIASNKLLLKNKYEEAKKLGEKANKYRLQIRQIKSSLGRKQEYREAQRLIQGQESNVESLVQEETSLREQLSLMTTSYKTSYQELKEMKMEIEHLQHLLENARLKLQKDFEMWLISQWSFGDKIHQEKVDGPQSHPPPTFLLSMEEPQEGKYRTGQDEISFNAPGGLQGSRISIPESSLSSMATLAHAMDSSQEVLALEKSNPYTDKEEVKIPAGKFGRRSSFSESALNEIVDPEQSTSSFREPSGSIPPRVISTASKKNRKSAWDSSFISCSTSLPPYPIQNVESNSNPSDFHLVPSSQSSIGNNEVPKSLSQNSFAACRPSAISNVLGGETSGAKSASTLYHSSSRDYMASVSSINSSARTLYHKAMAPSSLGSTMDSTTSASNSLSVPSTKTLVGTSTTNDKGMKRSDVHNDIYLFYKAKESILSGRKKGHETT